MVRKATFQAHSKAETLDAESFCALLNLYVKMGLHEKGQNVNLSNGKRTNIV